MDDGCSPQPPPIPPKQLPMTSPTSNQFPLRLSSKENTSHGGGEAGKKKSLPVHIIDQGTRLQSGPLSPVHVNSASDNHIPQASSAQIETYFPDHDRSRTPSGEQLPIRSKPQNESARPDYFDSSPRMKPRLVNDVSASAQNTPDSISSPWLNVSSGSPQIVTPDEPKTHSRHGSGGRRHGSRGSVRSDGSSSDLSKSAELAPGLQYHHQLSAGSHRVRLIGNRGSRSSNGTNEEPLFGSAEDNRSGELLGPVDQRPISAYSSNSDLRGRRQSGLSPNRQARGRSAHAGRSPESRPISYIDLLNIPYPQPAPAPLNYSNNHLQDAVGTAASLLSTQKTLEMYRANVKKTNDPAIQYEFAVFMINAAQEASLHSLDDPSTPPSTLDPDSLLRESRHILQRLSDRSYPFAQYYLADGYASGLFAKGKEDNDRAFPLFIAASKHGHAEAGYRAALCYEFGWGTRKDPSKAVQFYRQSASKNHPGAMARLGAACLKGEMGLGKRDREGLKWLKRAAESADFQYNSAPYELGCMHETGWGDDVFRDEGYAAQLYTQSADLGHAEAAFQLGNAYEHGLLTCPRDPALSVHFYTIAAMQGHPGAMMCMCAWYMVGADPVLERDDREAYEWAKRAAEAGLAKAEYCVGFFTEMGIGCFRDPLEANVWYVRAADQGDPRAKVRIAEIRAAASGGRVGSSTTGRTQDTASTAVEVKKTRKKGGSPVGVKDEEEKKGKKWGLF